ncbi:hypothetical protein BKG92_04425 [Rodentibacter ratti]|uniref:Uncharacterized protein n=1 Tax=Rodentibacter ratti TaxID=1906745 RepID=A0A1V3KZD0_9PAST|nr:hypothetical protein [Rodentibacter ratti]OOF83024.1 hypothetical protein BKG92_04425 [Rodentibacter ratti]
MKNQDKKEKYAKQAKICFLAFPLIAFLGIFDYSKVQNTDGEMNFDSLTFTAKFLFKLGGEQAVLFGPLIFALLILLTGVFFFYKSK